MPKPGYLSEYARHAGISKQAATKKLKRAGIDYSKPFDFSKADALIAAGHHPARAKYRKGKQADPPKDAPKELGEPESFLDAQRRKEIAKADEAELKVRERAGELIEAKRVEQTTFELSRQVRDSMLSIPDRIAGPLAAEMDQSKVFALLTKEIQQALEGLTAQ